MTVPSTIDYDRFWLLDVMVRWPCPARHIFASTEIQRAQLNKAPHYMDRAEIDANLGVLVDAGLVTKRSRNAYQLTSKGGAIWEKLAKPDWNRFWRDTYDEYVDGTTIVDIECHSPSKIVELENELSLLRIRGFYMVALRPWQMTYWKQRDQGYRARYFAPEEWVPDRHWCEIGLSVNECSRKFPRLGSVTVMT